MRMRESAQLKTVLELYDMGIHQNKSMPNYQKLKMMVEKKHRSETQIEKLWRQKRENSDRGSGYEPQGFQWRWERRGICFQWKAQAQCSRGDQCSFFRHDGDDLQNRHQKPRHPQSHQHQEVEMRREKGASEAEASLESLIDSCVMSVFTSRKRHVNLALSAHFRTGRLRNNLEKGRRRMVTKVQ